MSMRGKGGGAWDAGSADVDGACGGGEDADGSGGGGIDDDCVEWSGGDDGADTVGGSGADDVDSSIHKENIIHAGQGECDLQ